MRKFIIWVFVIILVVFSVILVKKIFFQNDEAEIKQIINTAAADLEKDNMPQFIKQFTPDYRDDFGNTYGTLYVFVNNYLTQVRGLNIKLSDMEIKIEKTPEGKEAHVKFFASATAVADDGEFVKQAGRFYLDLRKEQLSWKIYHMGEIEFNFQ